MSPFPRFHSLCLHENTRVEQGQATQETQVRLHGQTELEQSQIRQEEIDSLDNGSPDNDERHKTQSQVNNETEIQNSANDVKNAERIEVSEEDNNKEQEGESAGTSRSPYALPHVKNNRKLIHKS